MRPVVESSPSSRSAYEFDDYKERQDDAPRKGGQEIGRKENEGEALARDDCQRRVSIEDEEECKYSEFTVHQAPKMPAMAPLAPREETWNPLLNTQ